MIKHQALAVGLIVVGVLANNYTDIPQMAPSDADNGSTTGGRSLCRS